MSHRRQVEQHRQKLHEIRDIMDSMKTLAYMETRKLAAPLAAQHAALAAIEEAVADLLHFFPLTVPPSEGGLELLLLIGSERGFCGDFNEALITHAQQMGSHRQPQRYMAVGHKLHTLLQAGPTPPLRMAGASVVEEVEIVLAEIVRQLFEQQQRHPALTLLVLYHNEHSNGVVTERLLPPFQPLSNHPCHHANPPLLQLPADEVILSMSHHYLYAALFHILYSSLMAESHRRVTHLEGAVQHLDEREAALVAEANRLRQEEIIEEIEIILLSGESAPYGV